jgi:hypothetical protein
MILLMLRDSNRLEEDSLEELRSIGLRLRVRMYSLTICNRMMMTCILDHDHLYIITNT